MKCFLQCILQWHESVKKELFCIFLMTILFHQMNDNHALPAPWCGFSGIIKCLTYHISSLPLPTHFKPQLTCSLEKVGNLCFPTRSDTVTDLTRASHYAKWPPPGADLQDLPVLILTQNDSIECQLVQPADMIKTAL